MEFGDLLFALINVCRYYKVNPEEALAMANEKFYRRFQYIEQKVKQSRKDWSSYSLDQLDEIWEEAKGRGYNMRLDKFLKVSRLIKRRTLAKEVAEQGRVFINGQQAKASSTVK